VGWGQEAEARSQATTGARIGNRLGRFAVGSPPATHALGEASQSQSTSFCMSDMRPRLCMGQGDCPIYDHRTVGSVPSPTTSSQSRGQTRSRAGDHGSPKRSSDDLRHADRDRRRVSPPPRSVDPDEPPPGSSRPFERPPDPPTGGRFDSPVLRSIGDLVTPTRARSPCEARTLGVVDDGGPRLMKIIADTLELSNTARKLGDAFTRGVVGNGDDNVIQEPLVDRCRTQIFSAQVGTGRF